MNNQDKFNEYRSKYKDFIYHSYDYTLNDNLEITYNLKFQDYVYLLLN